jgi:GT2 family glycosyltransferase
MNMPFVSVVIPTHNRRKSLQRTLNALSRIRNYPLPELEVVVVVDGSTDDTVEMLRHYNAAFTLQVVEQPCLGPAAARNHGAGCAAGKLLVFLDDDIEASPSLIDVHTRAHQQRPCHVVIGYSPPVLARPVDFFHMRLRAWYEAMFNSMFQSGHRFEYHDLLSGNLSISAELFARVGGFDRIFLCHEDWELGIRLIKAGVCFTFAEEAIGQHHTSVDLDSSLQRKFQEGTADVMLGHRYPELRQTLLLARLERSYPGRVLRTLAFDCRWGRHALVAGLKKTLHLLENMRLFAIWCRVLDSLLGYYYWSGVAEVLGGRKELVGFLHDASSPCGDADPDIEIDLSQGLEMAEKLLDEQRPASAEILYGRWLIGHIPAIPGSERLRSEHLRTLLATQFAKPLLKALAMEGAIGLGFGCSRARSDPPELAGWGASREAPQFLHDERFHHCPVIPRNNANPRSVYGRE